MKRPTLIAGGLVAALVALGAVAGAFVLTPEIAPIDPNRQARLDPELVQKGASLAAFGDCNTCHTAPDGQAFAGGLPMPTPFGTIYSTNLTPDPETGIGRWSKEAFRRAMREGVDREGGYLYPAFPYDHFTLVSDADDDALYAFLMTRKPAHATAPVNGLPFPLNQRPLLLGWNLLFLKRGPFKPDPAHDDLWNRGAYLVEGIGHCGACHSPRNMFGAEKRNEAFAGGEAEGWRAFPINASSPAPIPWDADTLYGYLRQGSHGLHGVAGGPMAPVADNLASVPDLDVRAIAVYVASLMGEPAQERREQGERLAAVAKPFGPGGKPQSGGSQAAPPQAAGGVGAAIYGGACASCHESGRPVPYGGIDLALSTVINGENPRNLLNILLAGLPAADGVRAPIMPAFGAILTDAQIGALTSYLRSEFSTKPAWSDIRAQVREARDDRADANLSWDARQISATSH
jgi:mono/diheme cytochrome c family protein